MDEYFSGIGVDYDMISLNIGFYLGHEPIYKVWHRKRRFRKLYQNYLREAKKRGIETIGWTVNNKKNLKYFKNSSIGYILTDNVGP